MKSAVLLALLCASCAFELERMPFDPSPVQAGDRWTYRESNAYNGSPRGKTEYQIVATDEEGIRVEVSSDQARTTRVYPSRWSEFELVDGRRFIFAADGLERRAVAFNPETGQSIPITVYSRISGREKVSVPAGEFDAIRISRNIYVADREWYKSPTRIRQSEWYSPSVSPAVKRESRASYDDFRRSHHDGLIEGEWTRWELASHSALRR
jgi:hypothetical protein